MPRPAKGYRLADGTRVPGVTTITGRFKDSGGLIHWAWQQGIDGGNYRDTTQAAADAGTVAHGLVEQHVNGIAKPKVSAGTPRDTARNARKAFAAYLAWEKTTGLDLLSHFQEQALVSERYRFGGTPDAVAAIDGKLSLCDWKTSGGIYPEHLLQGAAYIALWNETHPTRPITGGMHLLRFDKEHGDFHHHHFAELRTEWQAFQLERRLYDLMKDISRRAR